MATLTTQHGIKWNVTQYNGRVAFEREQLTILWIESKQSYVMVDAEFRLVMVAPMQECLDAVQYNIN